MRIKFEELKIGESFVYREQLWIKAKDYNNNHSCCFGCTRDRYGKCNLGMIEEIAPETLVWKVTTHGPNNPSA